MDQVVNNMEWRSVRKSLPKRNYPVLVGSLEKPTDFFITKRSNEYNTDKNGFKTYGVFENVEFWLNIKDEDWISVEDKLPQMDEDVVVKTQNDFITCSHRADPNKVITDPNGFVIIPFGAVVLYWVRIPKLPNINKKNKQADKQINDQMKEQTSNWISVEDSLPAFGEDVLVCNVNMPKRNPYITHRSDREIASTDINRFCDNYTDAEVTHWMKLPTKPDKVEFDKSIYELKKGSCVVCKKNQFKTETPNFQKGERYFVDNTDGDIALLKGDENIKGKIVYIPLNKLRNYFYVIGEELAKKEKRSKNLDAAVYHPSHYTWLKELCGIEVIDITRHFDNDLGNVLKYILRHGRKHEEGISDKDKTIQDLKKAAVYLEDEIKMLESK